MLGPVNSRLGRFHRAVRLAVLPVAVVVVIPAAANLEAVDDDADGAMAGGGERGGGAQDGFARGAAGADDEADGLRVLDEEEGVADGVDRGGVDDDAVEFRGGLGEQRAEVGAAQKLGGVRRAAAGGEDEEVRLLRLVDRELEDGLAGEQVAEAGGDRFVQQGGRDRRAAQIGVDEQRAQALLRQGDSVIDRAEGLPFSGNGAREEGDFAQLRLAEQRERGAQGAERFGGGRGDVFEDERAVAGIAGDRTEDRED